MTDKPKCPVFGCTIPRNIPHTHPAGVSAIDDLAMRNLEDAAGNISPETYQALHSALEILRAQASPMVPGRKLRDALLMAGHKAGDTLTMEEIKPEPRRSFVKLIGSIAWRLALVMLVVGVTVLVLAGARP